MKGFKDSTKTHAGHGAGKATKEHWSLPIARKAMGGSINGPGIVAPMGGKAPGMNAGAARPIMPRPHVMPNMKAMGQPKMAHFAKGGSVDAMHGNSEMHTGPYSENEKEHPTPAARPGFKKGGKVKKRAAGGPACDEPAVRKIADQEVGKHVASSKPAGHGVKPKGGLAFMREPFCGGGRS